MADYKLRIAKGVAGNGSDLCKIYVWSFDRTTENREFISTAQNMPLQDENSQPPAPTPSISNTDYWAIFWHRYHKHHEYSKQLAFIYN
jgi:hypothetical protein